MGLGTLRAAGEAGETVCLYEAEEALELLRCGDFGDEFMKIYYDTNHALGVLRRTYSKMLVMDVYEDEYLFLTSLEGATPTQPAHHHVLMIRWLMMGLSRDRVLARKVSRSSSIRFLAGVLFGLSNFVIVHGKFGIDVLGFLLRHHGVPPDSRTVVQSTCVWAVF